MNSSMVICAGAVAGAAGVGIAVVVAAAGSGCGGIGDSLTGFAPCGVDSIRGNNDVPLRMVVPGARPPHSTRCLRIGESKSIERPSWWLMVCALAGINAYVAKLKHRNTSAM